MEDKIKVHIADDHKILIEGIIALINTDDSLQADGYSLTGKELIDWTSNNEIDVLILDISMPVLDGIEVLKILKRKKIPHKTILLSSYDDVQIAKKVLKIVDFASKEVRDLSHTLHSSILHKFGLPFAIKDIAEMYSNSQIKIHTELDIDIRYSIAFENKVYNIVQELINNVLKHSEAQNAVILLKEHNGTLKIVISDDGIGFDKNKVKNKDGIGINQIEARVYMLKGLIQITSEEGGGTKIEINLPILNTEKLLNHDLPVL